MLDLGCGTGRFLVPLSAEGFDVDGVDVSADMIEAARAQLPAPRAAHLSVQALHELRLDRTYRTAYMCGVFGIGGSRDLDNQAMHRAYQSHREHHRLLQRIKLRDPGQKLLAAPC